MLQTISSSETENKAVPSGLCDKAQCNWSSFGK